MLVFVDQAINGHVDKDHRRLRRLDKFATLPLPVSMERSRGPPSTQATNEPPDHTGAFSPHRSLFRSTITSRIDFRFGLSSSASQPADQTVPFFDLTERLKATEKPSARDTAVYYKPAQDLNTAFYE